MNIFLRYIVFVFFVSALGCSSVTINDRGFKQGGQPNYEESYSYFLFGIVGEHSLNVREVCEGQAPVQMRTQETFLDGFLTLITLGIYSPRTAQVWCPKGEKS